MTRNPSPRRPARAVTLAAVVAGVAISGVYQASAQRELRDRSVFVSVTKDDKPVGDLTATDFLVREDGVAREVLRVTPAPPPTHVSLLLDDSAATTQLTTDLRQAVSGFVRLFEDTQPAPAFGLMTFGDRPTKVLDFTASVPAVMTNIGRVFPRSGAGSYFLDAIVQTCGDLKKAEAARPIIVAVVDENGPEFSDTLRDKVVEALKSARASLWVAVLQARSADLSSREARERASVLGDVTRDSGGSSRQILSRQGLAGGMTALGNMINARVAVVYGRPESIVPPSKLEVESRRRDVRLVAPRWTGQ